MILQKYIIKIKIFLQYLIVIRIMYCFKLSNFKNVYIFIFNHDLERLILKKITFLMYNKCYLYTAIPILSIIEK